MGVHQQQHDESQVEQEKSPALAVIAEHPGKAVPCNIEAGNDEQDIDTYYMKIHDMAFGFKNALKKARNMAEAREILSRKFDEYLGGMGTNVVTKVSGLGSMLGEFKNIDPNIIAEIKEQIINEFMEKTLKLPEGDLSNFDYNLVKSEDEEGLLKLETGND